ncbi:hypothetical protein ANTQUA_LOCUS3655 [Anthophora quadrimaculata]
MATTLPQSSTGPRSASTMEVDNSVAWSVVSPKKKKATYSNHPGEGLKRSASPTVDIHASLKRKPSAIMEQASPTSASLKYPSGHTGPATVILTLQNDYCTKNKTHNMLKIGKAINSLRVGAHTILPRGFNRAEAYFNNGQEANRLLDLPALPGIGIKAYVPRQKVEKKGLLRGISLDLDLNELIQTSTSPCKITYAKRLSRRQVDPTTKEASWEPSETVLLTFEESMVPENIRIYGLLNRKVTPYIERVRTCQNCGRYGHTAAKCRGAPTCLNCGQKKSTDPYTCPSEGSCLHCRDHHQQNFGRTNGTSSFKNLTDKALSF